MDKLPVGQLPDLQQSNNDDEIMVITNSEYNQLKKEKISDFITDLTSTDENNALTKGTDGKMFVTDFGNASNITEGTLPTSVLPEIPLEKIPDIPKDKLPPIETADLPVSGVSADTYAYPSSVTVNAQGQVTAIEEGTPSGSNANTDLSNITEDGKEVIRQNSGGGLEVLDIGIAPCGIDETENKRRYTNGQLIIQEQFPVATSKLKARVGWQPNSAPNVDLVGSVINTNGVLSGFSNDNYAVIPKSFGSEPWAAVFKIYTNNDFSVAQGYAGVPNQMSVAVNANSKFLLAIDFSGGSWANNTSGTYNVLANTDYWIKINYTGTQYTLAYSLTGEDNSFVTDITINNSTALDLSNFRLGYFNTSGLYFKGSIDLNESYININGSRFWSGMRGSATLRPNLVKTETEWQAIKASSAYGQVGAFVIDDDAGTIRLPAVVNIQGLFDLQNAGLTVDAGLPNITGSLNTGAHRVAGGNAQGGLIGGSGALGASLSQAIGGFNNGNGWCNGYNVDFDASRSNPIYGNSDTVQPEAIQYPYFIQVATGAEYEEPVINEYTVTSAYSYGMSQYYPGIMNNNAWLRSNGQWNSGDVYVGLYNWILEQVNSGVEGFKGQIGYGYADTDNIHYYWISTATPVVGMTVYGYSDPIVPCGEIASVFENGFTFIDTVNLQQYTLYRNNSRDNTNTEHWITDYDWVINTTNQTFRLPLLDGSEDLPGTKYTNVTPFSVGTTYIAPTNGWLNIVAVLTGNGNYLYLLNATSGLGQSLNRITAASQTGQLSIYASKGDVLQLEGNAEVTTSSATFKFLYAKGNGNLYYYCGNVEQNTQLVNVARIEEKLVDKTDWEQAASASAPSKQSISLTPVSGTNYTAPATGWFCLTGVASAGGQQLSISTNNVYYNTTAYASPNHLQVSCFCKKGEQCYVWYNAPNNTSLKFIYAEGEVV